MLWALWFSVAFALGIAEAFPKVPLAGNDPQALAALGPAASVYDEVTATPGAASLIEQELEETWKNKKLRPAPDSLRRYAHFLLAARARGEVPAELSWFAAEHVGLPAIPTPVMTFVLGADTSGAAKMFKDIDFPEDVQAIVVATEPWEHGYRGIVLVLAGAVDLEPFPRVWQPGDVASVPGAMLRKDREYALYVAEEGARVKEYLLAERGGRFDVEVPLPATPGAYRVALEAFKRQGFPDSGFFFTFYVGQAPPTAPPNVPPVAAETEAGVLDGINAARARFGLSPLESAGDATALREFMAGLPESEVGRVRAFRQFGRTDPLPGRPHGPWAGMSAEGDSAARAVWTMTENPVGRIALLAPESRSVLVAGVPSPFGTYWLTLTFEAAPEAASVATEVREAVTAKFPEDPSRSPTMDAGLEQIAAAVASGDIPSAAGMRKVKALLKVEAEAGHYKGGASMQMYTWMPGQPNPGYADLTVPGEFHGLGLGVATGDLGRKGGQQVAVAIVVLAGSLSE